MGERGREREGEGPRGRDRVTHMQKRVCVERDGQRRESSIETERKSDRERERVTERERRRHRGRVKGRQEEEETGSCAPQRSRERNGKKGAGEGWRRGQ